MANVTEIIQIDAEPISVGATQVVQKKVLTGEVSYFDIASLNSVYSNAVSFDSDFINDFSNDNECEITGIIGSDGRIKITTTTTYSYSAILYIEISWPDGATGLGTAFMIDDNLAATAGHCVYDASHGG